MSFFFPGRLPITFLHLPFTLCLPTISNCLLSFSSLSSYFPNHFFHKIIFRYPSRVHSCRCRYSGRGAARGRPACAYPTNPPIPAHGSARPRWAGLRSPFSFLETMNPPSLACAVGEAGHRLPLRPLPASSAGWTIPRHVLRWPGQESGSSRIS